MVTRTETNTFQSSFGHMDWPLNIPVDSAEVADAGSSVTVCSGCTRRPFPGLAGCADRGLPKRSQVVVRIDPLDEQRGPANRSVGDALVANAEGISGQYELTCLFNVGFGFSGPGGDGGGEARPETIPAVA